ncbi:hypothetical protein LXT23_47520, partial [Pyxidicoccus sp. QH1ED-7-1]|nr:hypothetical protein [Pyxidicoccus xibeiensis]
MKRPPGMQESPAATVETPSQPMLALPTWLPEAVLLLKHWRDSGLLHALQTKVLVPRGRMGHFEVCDFVLVLLAYTVSGERTLAALFTAMTPCAAALAALWQRERLPSRAALSRFLAAVPASALEALRAMLFHDLCAHGLTANRTGGLIDRAGHRQLVFDIDGTRQVARQRQVVFTAAHPPVRRRLVPLCAPGYTGRKRGEVTRTRTVIQQAHTHEWLGTFGHPGNGEAFVELERSCAAIVAYLHARGLPPTAGVLRLDGLYGFARYAWAMSQAGLGYVVRCCDYRLLEMPEVQAQLGTPSTLRFVQPETGTLRTVYDVGVVAWTAGADPTLRVPTRLVVTASPAPEAGAPAVGHRAGDVVYELFATDRTAPGWSALDVLTLYAARGGFEQTLAEEDREQHADRWCSGQAHGQELWQVLCQWVWNQRLRLGVAAQAPNVRRTLWAPAATEPTPDAEEVAEAPAALVTVDVRADATHSPVGEVLASAEPEPTPEPIAAPTPLLSPVAPPSAATAVQPFGQVAPASGRGRGRFGGSDFTWQADGTLRCP